MLLRAAELVDAYNAESREARQARTEGRRRGPTTGLTQLDWCFGGYLPPGLYIVHGSAGAGKTALANQIAATCQAPAQFVSTEMAPLELLRRQVARAHSTARRVLLSGDLDPDHEQEMLEATLPEISQLYYTDAREPVDFTAVTANQMVVQSRSPFSLLVIDSVHTWASMVADPGVSEYDALRDALIALRALQKRYSIPVLMIGERNRAGMKAGDISAGAGSRKLEYAPDAVIALNVDEESSTPEIKQVNLKLLKNRFGPAGNTIPLTFYADTMTFAVKEMWHRAEA